MKKIFFTLFILTVLVVPSFADGQTPTRPPETTPVDVRIENPLKDNTNTLMELLVMILDNIIMPIAAVGVVMYIVYAGFTYVTAQGNPKKVEEAHQRLLWALVGAGILLGAAGIAKVLENTVDALIQT